MGQAWRVVSAFTSYHTSLRPDGRLPLSLLFGAGYVREWMPSAPSNVAGSGSCAWVGRREESRPRDVWWPPLAATRRLGEGHVAVDAAEAEQALLHGADGGIAVWLDALLS